MFHLMVCSRHLYKQNTELVCLGIALKVGKLLLGKMESLKASHSLKCAVLYNMV